MNGHAVAVTLTARPITDALKRTREPWANRGGSTLRDLTPFDLKQKAFGQSGGLFGLMGALAGEDELRFAYVESAIFHACARARADAAATVPWIVKDGPGDKAKPLQDSDPLVKFFANPSPLWSPAQIKDAIEVHLCEAGESFVFLADKNGDPVATDVNGYITEIPAQMIPVSGLGVLEERDNATGIVTHWGFQPTGSSRQVKFPRAAVIHFMVYSSADPERGIGPAQVLARQLALAFQFERYQEASARNFGPGGFLISEKPMVQEEQDAAQLATDEMMTDPKSPSTLKLLQGAWKFEPNPGNAQAMQVLELMQENVRIVCSTMGVPGPVVGRYEDAKYSTTTNARQEFWIGRGGAEQRKCDVWTSQLLKKLRANGKDYSRCVMEADLSNIDALNVDETDRYEKAAKMVASGCGLSFDEVCKTLGLPTIKTSGGTLAWIPATLRTIDQALEGPPEPSPSVSTPPPDADAPAKHGPAPVRRLFDSYGPFNADERKAYSAAYIERVFTPHERPLYRHVLTWRTNYARAQIAQLEAFASGPSKSLRVTRDIGAGDGEIIDAEILLDRQRWAALLDSAMRSTLLSAWNFSLADAAAEIGVIAMPMADPRIIEAFYGQMVKLTEGVTSRLAQQVKETILETLRNSGSIGTLQERIKQDLDAIKLELDSAASTRPAFANTQEAQWARALNIARTETGHAASTARFLQFQAEGVEEIQWIAEQDDATRPAHAARDGEVKKLGSEFAPNMKHPHDPNGPAGEVINCRCTYIAIVNKEERAAA